MTGRHYSMEQRYGQLQNFLLSRLDAFEMWVYRRVLIISWTEKITNEEVLTRMGTGREMVRQFAITELYIDAV